ncbi:NYN and OST-HTH LOTUS domain [Fusarium albosuccineum]|uniref:NYN and OST-HTH LOTUS domain n=1 Tax=Fusarium albosuccineum TaxID=1237068 RepID=A0A8H4KNR0_9HYPO|nr:NYN and OST-HTH LOTUS domain [Fusarium albosuccineum]
MASGPTVKLAVLIDADNAQPSMASHVLQEIAKYGTAFVKRAYGDWTGMNLKGWKDQLLKNSIQPIQQFAYTQGKNATDAAMVIDAMDLLYSNRFDGFCLISSDSDFTRLASRIRESGLVVYGCGERKTPQPFVTACDKFIYIENLAPKIESPKSIGLSSPKSITIGHGNIPTHVAAWIIEAVEATSDEDGWAGLANVGHLLVKRYPDFDPRTYGFTKLNELITATSMFEIDRRIPGEGKPAVVYLRDKKRSSRHNVAW